MLPPPRALLAVLAVVALFAAGLVVVRRAHAQDNAQLVAECTTLLSLARSGTDSLGVYRTWWRCSP